MPDPTPIKRRKKLGRPKIRASKVNKTTLPKGELKPIAAEFVVTSSEVILEVDNVLLMAPIPPDEVVTPRALTWAALRRHSALTLEQIAVRWGQETRTVQWWLRKVNRALSPGIKEGTNLEWKKQIQEIGKLAKKLEKLAAADAKRKKKLLPRRRRGEFLKDYQERCKIWLEEQGK